MFTTTDHKNESLENHLYPRLQSVQGYSSFVWKVPYTNLMSHFIHCNLGNRSVSKISFCIPSSRHHRLPLEPIKKRVVSFLVSNIIQESQFLNFNECLSASICPMKPCFCTIVCSSLSIGTSRILPPSHLHPWLTWWEIRNVGGTSFTALSWFILFKNIKIQTFSL